MTTAKLQQHLERTYGSCAIEQSADGYRVRLGNAWSDTWTRLKFAVGHAKFRFGKQKHKQQEMQ